VGILKNIQWVAMIAERSNMAIVYKIVNTITGQTYVGVTTKPLHKRWSDHKSCSKTLPKKRRTLYADMEMLGVDKFQIEPIEECDNDIRFEREKYWIKKLDAINSGYNKLKGSMEYDHKAIAENLKITGSTYETAKQTGAGVAHIWKIAKDFGIELGLCNEDKKIPVIAVTKDGMEIEFNSMSDGARYCIEHGLTKSTKPQHMMSNIRTVCDGKYQHTYGMEWRYNKVEATANDR
jgi:GIY-YIG catalytic domain